MVSFEKRLPQVVAIEKWECPTGVKIMFFIRDDGTAKEFARKDGEKIAIEQFTKDGLFVPPEGAVFDRLEL